MSENKNLKNHVNDICGEIINDSIKNLRDRAYLLYNNVIEKNWIPAKKYYLDKDSVNYLSESWSNPDKSFLFSVYIPILYKPTILTGVNNNYLVLFARIVIARLAHVSETIKTYSDGHVIFMDNIDKDKDFSNLVRTFLGELWIDNVTLDPSYNKNGVYKFLSDAYGYPVEYNDCLSIFLIGRGGLSAIISHRKVAGGQFRETDTAMLTPLGIVTTNKNVRSIKPSAVVSAAKNFVEGDYAQFFKISGLPISSFDYLLAKIKYNLTKSKSMKITFEEFWNKIDKENSKILDKLATMSFASNDSDSF